MRRALYPVLRLLRRLSWILSPGSDRGYDESHLASMIMETDKALLDSSAFTECEYLIQVIKTAQPKTLRVLDFGGGGGRHGFAFLSEVKSWAVVETPAMTEAAKELLLSDSLSFHVRIQDAKEHLGEVDVLHVSSSLQYTPDPMGTLLELLSLNPEIVIFEKLVTTKRARSSRFLQYSFLGDNLAGHQAEVVSRWKSTRYPLTAMSNAEVLKVVQEKYEFDGDWVDPAQSHLPFGKGLKQWGFTGHKRA